MNDAPRVVLDTNVCLDVFVFADAHGDALRAAMDKGEVAAVTNDACRDEWRAVLAYPELALDASRQVTALAASDQWLTPLALRVDANARKLPRCADPDDQKFLELAQACGARWLLSRDKELLKLARRTRRDHGFDVLTPADWAKAYAAPASS